MVSGAVTGQPTAALGLGWETLETCDRCGPGVNAIWLVFTAGGDLTFCGKHYRDFCKAREGK